MSSTVPPAPPTTPHQQAEPLMRFHCVCGYEESIGVDIHAGVVITGPITLICPRCGHIYCNPGPLLNRVRVQP